MRMSVVATIGLLGILCGGASAQDDLRLPAESVDLVRAFVPDEFEIADLQQARISLGQDDLFTGRVMRFVAVPAQARDGSEWLLKFGIDEARSYVGSYSADPREADSLEFLRKRDFALSRDEVEAIAREFAVSRFPRSLERLTLVRVSEPLPPAAGGFPLFSFRWEGRVSDRADVRGTSSTRLRSGRCRDLPGSCDRAGQKACRGGGHRSWRGTLRRDAHSQPPPN